MKVDTPYKNSWADQQNSHKYSFALNKPTINRLRIRGFRVRLADLGKGNLVEQLKEV